jgi:hypothetical protein
MAETFLRPFRYHNYEDEYLRHFFNNYGIMGPMLFCTYFKFDIDESTIDDRPHVQAGTYHTFGPKSGRKWKKIQLLPIWRVQAHGPVEYKAREEGVIRELETSFWLPDYMGVRPTPKDFLHIFDGVTNTESNKQPLYRVKNKEESHVGKRKMYRVICENYHGPVTSIDKPEHVISEWIYVNHYRKIFSYDVGELILNTLSNNITLFDNINKDLDYNFVYNNNTCMFSVKV